MPHSAPCSGQAGHTGQATLLAAQMATTPYQTPSSPGVDALEPSPRAEGLPARSSCNTATGPGACGDNSMGGTGHRGSQAPRWGSVVGLCGTSSLCQQRLQPRPAAQVIALLPVAGLLTPHRARALQLCCKQRPTAWCPAPGVLGLEAEREQPMHRGEGPLQQESAKHAPYSSKRRLYYNFLWGHCSADRALFKA